MEACDEVCVNVPCVSESAQALVETVAVEHSLVVTDAPAIVEAVAYLFAEEPVPKAPDKYALCWSDATLTERGPAAAGVVSSGSFWWELSVPSLAERVPPDKISCMNGMTLL